VKLLLDSCVSGASAAELRRAGLDVEWVGDWPEDPGDETILRRATEARRVVVTLDKDFGELAVLRGLRHAGIIRVVGFRAATQAQQCLTVIARCAADLEVGALVTVEPGRMRIRSAS
jgi:predicted nuclease of predicted toxin-antitoxin system